MPSTKKTTNTKKDYVPVDNIQQEEEAMVTNARNVYSAKTKATVWKALQDTKIDDEYRHGTIVKIAKQFGVKHRLVKNAIQKGKASMIKGTINFADQRQFNGHTCKYNPCELANKSKKLTIQSRLTVRDSAHGLNMPWSLLFQYTKKYGVPSNREQQLKWSNNKTKSKTKQLKPANKPSSNVASKLQIKPTKQKFLQSKNYHHNRPENNGPENGLHLLCGLQRKTISNRIERKMMPTIEF